MRTDELSSVAQAVGINPASRVNVPIPVDTKHVVGVYLLWWRGEVVYVGQSVDVLARIDTHVKEGVKLFDSASYFPCPIEQLHHNEILLIDKLKPHYNGLYEVGAAGARKILAAVSLAVDHIANWERDSKLAGQLTPAGIHRDVSNHPYMRNTGLCPHRFFRFLHADTRVEWDPSSGVYRLAPTGDGTAPVPAA